MTSPEATVCTLEDNGKVFQPSTCGIRLNQQARALNTEPKTGLTAVSAGRRGTRGITAFINKRKQYPTKLRSTVKIMVGVAAKQSDFVSL